MVDRPNTSGGANQKNERNFPRTGSSPSGGEQRHGKKGDSYKNIETSVGNRESFGDEYETEADDKIILDEGRSEKERRPDRS